MVMEESAGSINEAYRPFPSVTFVFMFIWYLSSACWIINTYRNRHFQTNKLQWTLAAVPLIKSLQLTLSFLFWYSCFYLHVCSLWMSFGVFVTGVLFQTATFVSFLLISHGYCITCELLSVAERRRTATFGCIFYLTLIGYRTSIPYFSAFLLLNYFVSFYGIFRLVSQNLILLREQLAIIEDEDVHAMREAVFTKYIMFKKFQGAMHMLAMAELAIFINMDSSLENSWLRSTIREWAHFLIFLYVGWIFRSQAVAPRFSLMPTHKYKGHNIVPPIYSIEMDAATFRDISSHSWHIGVPTSSKKGQSEDSILVVIQHPHAERLTSTNSTSPSTATSSSSAHLSVHSNSFCQS
ncbi:hypothetical protein M9H77_37262 [Catharanthus roseus]|uniref:Uncharacterized protein n=1 Tax=Catharanthus roseus TaxID=4058 RepID=A0ACB9ZYE9_CATRO|nr:hypothetical protein M9H77_37262 [Catharanthus roseus]